MLRSLNCEKKCGSQSTSTRLYWVLLSKAARERSAERFRRRNKRELGVVASVQGFLGK